MKRTFKNLHKHPLVILPPLIYALVLIWNGYLYSRQHLSVPQENLLTNGNFTEFSGSGATGWQVARYGSSQYTTTQVPGHVHGKSLQMTVSSYSDGNVDLLSPIVNVSSGQSYLFKGYYSSNSPFDLLARYYDADGSSRLVYLQNYMPSTNDMPWATVSNAFKTDARLRAVQFVYRFATNTTAKLSGNYLEQRDAGDVALSTTSQARTTSALAIPAVSNCNGTPPAPWSPYSIGTNKASFGYTCDAGGNIFHAAITNYASGEAKWQYAPVSVQAAAQYCVSLDYKGSAGASVVAEYAAGQTHQFSTLQNLSPAGVFTHVEATTEAPSNGTLMATGVLRSNGSLDIRNVSVKNCSTPGPTTFKRPIISIAFDDGWLSSYQNSAQLLAAKNIKATYYVSPINLDTPYYMTSSDIATLQRHGNEIASRSLQPINLTTINGKELDYQLHTGSEYIQQLTARKPADFAAPYGAIDSEVTAAAQRYYQGMRGTSSGVNTRQNFQQYNLKVFVVTRYTKPQDIQAAIARAKQSNAWLIVVYHGLDAQPATISATTPDLFAQEVALMQQSTVPLVTVQQAMAELLPQL